MNIGIVGSGIMGRSIAFSAILHQHSVVLYDANNDVADKALEWIESQILKGVEKGKITAETAARCKSAIRRITTLEELLGCNLVIEAIAENVDAKLGLIRSLESVVTSDAIIATNTSSISIARLSKDMQYPQRFAGLHFFNPAHIMRLVEVIRGPKTTQETVDVCVQVAMSLEKTPVIARDVPGFIVNRIARNFYNEAQRIVTEGGATVEAVDASLKGLGFRMGPFELMDLIGVGTNLDVTTNQWEQFYYEPRFQPSVLQRQIVDAGLTFTKSK